VPPAGAHPEVMASKPGRLAMGRLAKENGSKLDDELVDITISYVDPWTFNFDASRFLILL
jgi:hypothetical protein